MNKKKGVIAWLAYSIVVFILCVIIASAYGADRTFSVEQSATTTPAAVEKKLTDEEIIDRKMWNTRKFVQKLIQDKKRLVAAEIEYIDALNEMNGDLGAADLYGGGTIELYFDIASELGLIGTSTVM